MYVRQKMLDKSCFRGVLWPLLEWEGMIHPTRFCLRLPRFNPSSDFSLHKHLTWCLWLRISDLNYCHCTLFTISKKLVSLAAEKLVSEIVHDTTTYSRMKDQDGDILKMEDLKESLGKYGVEKFKIRATEEEKKEEEGGKGGGGEVAFGGEKSLGSGREGRGGGGGRRAPSRNS